MRPIQPQWFQDLPPDAPRRVYRLLLALFPRRFREESGPEMIRLFEEMRAERVEGRGRPGASFWLAVARDALGQAVAERLRPSRRQPAREPLLADTWQDLRHALTSLRARPSFTLAVVATLALGLGATTAVTSVVHTVVLAPPPYAEPDEIVQIARERDGRSLQLPAADVRLLDEATTRFLTLGVSRFQDVAISDTGTPERVRGVLVTGATLEMLGVPPLLGRLPDESDDVPGGPCVAVLSHRIWTEHFGAARGAIGSAMRLDGAPCTVLAVMPRGFAYPAPYFAPGDLWLLAGPAGVDWTAEGGPGFLVFGRMAPGSSVSGIQAALEPVSARSETRGPFTAMRWAAPSRDASRQRLVVLLAAAALVLVIACVNVITLQLARYVDRRGEIATRMALGASRRRLARLLVTETAVLCAAGAAAGLLVAMWSVDLIVALRSFTIPRMEEVTIDGVSVVVCLGLAAAAGVVSAVIPALGLSRIGGSATLRPSGRGLTPTRGGRGFGRALVTVETTLAFVLLAGAALLLQSYGQLTALDPGFRSAGLLHARVTPPAGRYTDAQLLAAFYRDVEERVAGLPGVLDVSLTDVPPGVGAGAHQPFAVAGHPTPRDWPRAAWRTVSDGYLRTLDVPLVRGEGLDSRRGSERAVVVNEAFERRFFPEGDAVGGRLHLVESPRADAPRGEPWTIVGVAADIHEEFAHTPPPPAVYARLTDGPAASVAILARTAGEPLALAEPIREAVASVDPHQPVYGIRDLDFMLASEYDLTRLAMTLLALFAGAALLLAVAGIYGVVAHTVGERLREMGIRIALGAVGADVLRLIVGDCAKYAVTGALVGLALLAASGDLLRALTTGWVGLNAAAMVGAGIVATAVAIGAAYLPARKAASADPVLALRRE